MLRALIKKQTLEMLSFLFKSGKAGKMQLQGQCRTVFAAYDLGCGRYGVDVLVGGGNPVRSVCSAFARMALLLYNGADGNGHGCVFQCIFNTESAV